MKFTEFKVKHKLLVTYKYTWAPIDKGYNNRTLYVNVGDLTIKEKPVSQQMKDKFIGGKGFDLRLLWDATQPGTKWNDPDNEIVISGGPCCGITQYSGAGKAICCAISPQTDIIVDSNVGGFFGPFLKFCGFDALELQGKSDREVMILLDEEREVVEIYEAGDLPSDSHVLGEILHEMFAKEDNDKDKMNVAVVAAGTAAEHSLIGMLNFTFYDPKRKLVRLKQAGRGGLEGIERLAGRQPSRARHEERSVPQPRYRGQVVALVDGESGRDRAQLQDQNGEHTDASQNHPRAKHARHYRTPAAIGIARAPACYREPMAVQAFMTERRAARNCALCAIVVRLPALRGGFLMDDAYLIVENPAIRDLDNVPSFFTQPWGGGRGGAEHAGVNAAYYRPLTTSFTQLNYYRVVLEAARGRQSGPEALRRIYVSSPSGAQVPLSELATFGPGNAALAVNHQGQFPAITISFNLPRRPASSRSPMRRSCSRSRW